MEWRRTAGEFGPDAVLDCTINSPDTSTSGGTIISQDISTSGGAEPYDGDGGWCAAPDYPISNYLADRLDARCRAPQSPMFAFNLNSPIPAFAGGGLNILPSFTPSSSLSSLSGQRRGSGKRSVIPGSSCSEACFGCFSTDRCVRFHKTGLVFAKSINVHMSAVRTPPTRNRTFESMSKQSMIGPRMHVQSATSFWEVVKTTSIGT